MVQPEALTILVVNEQAEEVKLATISLRGFYPGCRVEAAYSAEEALSFASREQWHLILVDEILTIGAGNTLVQELRRSAPESAIIVQAERTDAEAALQAMNAGADSFLCKESPAFITELLFTTRDALERRDLRRQLEQSKLRYLRLLETVGDVVYELDASGHFIYLSPTASSLLGYSAEELLGRHYSTVLPADQQSSARYRFNDRRTGPRSSHLIELWLTPKEDADRPHRPVPVAITAKGLYDPRRRFLGTLGTIRDRSESRAQAERVRELEHRTRDTVSLLELARRLAALSQGVQGPLEILAAQTQQLLSAHRDLHVETRLETISVQAQEAARLGRELIQASEQRRPEEAGFSLSEALKDALAELLPATEASQVTVEQHLAADLPLAAGSAETLRPVIRTVLAQALQIVGRPTRGHHLTVATRYVAPAATAPETSTLFTLTPPAYVEAELVEGTLPTPEGAAGPAPCMSFGEDLFQAFHILEQAGGMLDLTFTPQQPMLIRFRLPTLMPSSIVAPPPPGVMPAQPPQSRETLPTPAPAAPITPTYPDRRRHARVCSAITVRMRVGSALWEGVSLNLGLSGMAMTFSTPFPPAEGRSCSLVFHTLAGTLDIPGTVRRCLTDLASGTDRPASLMAIEFAELGDTARLVMHSLLDELSTRALEVTVEGSITGDIPAALDPSMIAGGGDDSLDIRWDTRLPASIPVRVTPEGSSTVPPHLGLTVNISRTGLSLQVKGRPEAIPSMLDVQISPSGARIATVAEEQVPIEWTVTGQVVWMAADPDAPSELRPSPVEPGLRLGLRLTRVPHLSDRALDQLLARLLDSGVRPPAQDSSPIVSTVLSLRRADGKSITLVEDRLREFTDRNVPLVVISPGFSATKSDYLGLSYLLSANGFRVLRYDPLDHPGESVGEVHRATLGGLAEDLRAVMSYARRTWEQARIALVAFDLSARGALKIAGQDAAPDCLILCNPIYDLQEELKILHRRDLAGDYRLGVRRGIGNLFGLNVNIDRFLRDAEDGGFLDLPSSIRDAAQLRAPLVHVDYPVNVPRSADAPLPASESVGHVLAGAPAGSRRVSTHSCAPFGLDTLVPASALARELLAQCQSLVGNPAGEELPTLPKKSTIVNRRQLEHLRVRARKSGTFPDPQTLWLGYVQHLQQLAMLTDYWTLFDRLYHGLPRADRPVALLEMGCGRGELCRSLLVNRLYQLLHGGGLQQRPLQYLGLDLAVEGLQLARLNALAVARELEARFAKPYAFFPTVASNWIQTAWYQPLPFKDETFQVVVCTLGLSFVRHPLTALRDFWRVLQPNGQLLLT
jgi:PAS domain S-box-containing protein